MSELRAIGLICLDISDDAHDDERILKALADIHGYSLVSVIHFRSTESLWIFRILRALYASGAHAVMVADPGQLLDFSKAILGAADLITPSGSQQYVGYTNPGVRPKTRKYNAT